MYPGIHAQNFPDKPALIMAGSGIIVTYRELDEGSNRLAQFMYAQGLRKGDHVAIFMENNPRYHEVYWACARSGLLLTTVNRYLSAEEAAFIVNDCRAQVLVTSAAMAEVAETLVGLVPNCPHTLVVDGECTGYLPYVETLDTYPSENLAEQPRGGTMLYSSGTTGRPKGIVAALPEGDIDEDMSGLSNLLSIAFAMDENAMYLSPAPIYHSAPMGFTAAVQSLGGTVVMMERFDEHEAMRCIQDYRITHSQWVPTMFSRMLKLPAEERTPYDFSSHKVAVHAAAPCPPEVKRQMIDWWGPILYEYYAGTEVNGFTLVNSQEWLEHPGTVGRPLLGVVHICDEDGTELPVGEEGTIFFELPERPFEYYGDPEKTRSAEHPEHANWTALGDVGRVDEEGFLYLTDRKTFMIISGGVNIYPAESENILIMHPKVMDVAVFGVPNKDLGEEVKAVVQLVAGVAEDDSLRAELLAYCQQHLARFKCPKSIDFVDELPRLPTGKLYKRLIRDRYWGKQDSKIV